MVKKWLSRPMIQPVVVVEEPVTETAPQSPPKTCPECGKYHRRSEHLCAGCAFKAMVDSEPKQNPDRFPCAICGVTHVSPHTYAGKEVLWEKRGVSVYNKPIQGWLCGRCLEVKDRNLTPALGTRAEELVLSVRVLQEYGYAQPWRLRGADPWIKKTVIRDVMLLNPGERPKIAAEVQGYGPTTEPREAVAFLKINRGRLEKYMTAPGHRARPVGGHQDGKRTIDNLLGDVSTAKILAESEKIYGRAGLPGPAHDSSWRTRPSRRN